MRYGWLFCSFILVMALWSLTQGLFTFIKKRPYIYSARTNLIFMILPISPSLFVAIEGLFSGRETFSLALFIPFIIVPLIILFLWKQMNGYIFIGITEEGLRTGIHSVLKRMNLPFEESLSKIVLPSVGIDLEVTMQSWMGWAQIRTRQKDTQRTLGKIIDELNIEFATVPQALNKTTSIFYLVMGLVFLVMAFSLFSLENKPLRHTHTHSTIVTP